jgi:phosphatidylglycerol:prolipoprotein diacylglycerol transferase
MFPKLFSVDPYFTLHTYGLMMALAVFAGLLLAVRLAPRAGIPRENMWNFGVYMALAGLIGSRLMYYAAEWRYYSENPKQLFTWASLQAGGFFHGGLILAVLLGIWLVRREALSFMGLADAATPGIALGLAIARLGCFCAGCCWGKPADVTWAVTFTDPYAQRVVGVPLNIALHPTQLYESALAAVICIVLLLLWRRRAFPGQIFAAFLLLYGAGRFGLEFWRDDPRGPFFLDAALSTPQLISVILFVVGVVVWLRQSRPRREPPQPELSRK